MQSLRLTSSFQFERKSLCSLTTSVTLPRRYVSTTNLLQLQKTRESRVAEQTTTSPLLTNESEQEVKEHNEERMNKRKITDLRAIRSSKKASNACRQGSSTNYNIVNKKNYSANKRQYDTHSRTNISHEWQSQKYARQFGKRKDKKHLVKLLEIHKNLRHNHVMLQKNKTVYTSFCELALKALEESNILTLLAREVESKVTSSAALNSSLDLAEDDYMLYQSSNNTSNQNSIAQKNNNNNENSESVNNCGSDDNKKKINKEIITQNYNVHNARRLLLIDTEELPMQTNSRNLTYDKNENAPSTAKLLQESEREARQTEFDANVQLSTQKEEEREQTKEWLCQVDEIKAIYNNSEEDKTRFNVDYALTLSAQELSRQRQWCVAVPEPAMTLLTSYTRISELPMNAKDDLMQSVDMESKEWMEVTPTASTTKRAIYVSEIMTDNAEEVVEGNNDLATNAKRQPEQHSQEREASCQYEKEKFACYEEEELEQQKLCEEELHSCLRERSEKGEVISSHVTNYSSDNNISINKDNDKEQKNNWNREEDITFDKYDSNKAKVGNDQENVAATFAQVQNTNELLSFPPFWLSLSSNEFVHNNVDYYEFKPKQLTYSNGQGASQKLHMQEEEMEYLEEKINTLLPSFLQLHHIMHLQKEPERGVNRECVKTIFELLQTFIYFKENRVEEFLRKGVACVGMEQEQQRSNATLKQNLTETSAISLTNSKLESKSKVFKEKKIIKSSINDDNKSEDSHIHNNNSYYHNAGMSLIMYIKSLRQIYRQMSMNYTQINIHLLDINKINMLTVMEWAVQNSKAITKKESENSTKTNIPSQEMEATNANEVDKDQVTSSLIEKIKETMHYKYKFLHILPKVDKPIVVNVPCSSITKLREATENDNLKLNVRAINNNDNSSINKNMSGSISDNNDVNKNFKDANIDVMSDDKPTISFDQQIKKNDNSERDVMFSELTTHANYIHVIDLWIQLLYRYLIVYMPLLCPQDRVELMNMFSKPLFQRWIFVVVARWYGYLELYNLTLQQHQVDPIPFVSFCRECLTIPVWKYLNDTQRSILGSKLSVECVKSEKVKFTPFMNFYLLKSLTNESGALSNIDINQYAKKLLLEEGIEEPEVESSGYNYTHENSSNNISSCDNENGESIWINDVIVANANQSNINEEGIQHDLYDKYWHSVLKCNVNVKKLLRSAVNEQIQQLNISELVYIYLTCWSYYMKKANMKKITDNSDQDNSSYVIDKTGKINTISNSLSHLLALTSSSLTYSSSSSSSSSLTTKLSSKSTNLVNATQSNIISEKLTRRMCTNIALMAAEIDICQRLKLGIHALSFNYWLTRLSRYDVKSKREMINSALQTKSVLYTELFRTVVKSRWYPFSCFQLVYHNVLYFHRANHSLLLTSRYGQLLLSYEMAYLQTLLEEIGLTPAMYTRVSKLHMDLEDAEHFKLRSKRIVEEWLLESHYDTQIIHLFSKQMAHYLENLPLIWRKRVESLEENVDKYNIKRDVVIDKATNANTRSEIFAPHSSASSTTTTTIRTATNISEFMISYKELIQAGYAASACVRALQLWYYVNITKNTMICKCLVIIEEEMKTLFAKCVEELINLWTNVEFTCEVQRELWELWPKFSGESVQSSSENAMADMERSLFKLEFIQYRTFFTPQNKWTLQNWLEQRIEDTQHKSSQSPRHVCNLTHEEKSTVLPVKEDSEPVRVEHHQHVIYHPVISQWYTAREAALQTKTHASANAKPLQQQCWELYTAFRQLVQSDSADNDKTTHIIEHGDGDRSNNTNNRHLQKTESENALPILNPTKLTVAEAIVMIGVLYRAYFTHGRVRDKVNYSFESESSGSDVFAFIARGAVLSAAHQRNYSHDLERQQQQQQKKKSQKEQVGAESTPATVNETEATSSSSSEIKNEHLVLSVQETKDHMQDAKRLVQRVIEEHAAVLPLSTLIEATLLNVIKIEQLVEVIYTHHSECVQKTLHKKRESFSHNSKMIIVKNKNTNEQVDAESMSSAQEKLFTSKVKSYEVELDWLAQFQRGVQTHISQELTLCLLLQRYSFFITSSPHLGSLHYNMNNELQNSKETYYCCNETDASCAERVATILKTLLWIFISTEVKRHTHNAPEAESNANYNNKSCESNEHGNAVNECISANNEKADVNRAYQTILTTLHQGDINQLANYLLHLGRVFCLSLYIHCMFNNKTNHVRDSLSYKISSNNNNAETINANNTLKENVCDRSFVSNTHDIFNNNLTHTFHSLNLERMTRVNTTNASSSNTLTFLNLHYLFAIFLKETDNALKVIRRDSAEEVLFWLVTTMHTVQTILQSKSYHKHYLVCVSPKYTSRALQEHSLQEDEHAIKGTLNKNNTIRADYDLESSFTSIVLLTLMKSDLPYPLTLRSLKSIVEFNTCPNVNELVSNVVECSKAMESPTSLQESMSKLQEHSEGRDYLKEQPKTIKMLHAFQSMCIYLIVQLSSIIESDNQANTNSVSLEQTLYYFNSILVLQQLGLPITVANSNMLHHFQQYMEDGKIVQRHYRAVLLATLSVPALIDYLPSLFHTIKHVVHNLTLTDIDATLRVLTTLAEQPSELYGQRIQYYARLGLCRHANHITNQAEFTNAKQESKNDNNTNYNNIDEIKKSKAPEVGGTLKNDNKVKTNDAEGENRVNGVLESEQNKLVTTSTLGSAFTNTSTYPFAVKLVSRMQLANILPAMREVWKALVEQTLLMLLPKETNTERITENITIADARFTDASVLISAVECSRALACTDSHLFEELLACLLYSTYATQLSLSQWSTLLSTCGEVKYHKAAISAALLPFVLDILERCSLHPLHDLTTSVCSNKVNCTFGTNEYVSQSCIAFSTFIESLPCVFIEGKQFWLNVGNCVRAWVDALANAKGLDDEHKVWQQEIICSFDFAIHSAGHHSLTLSNDMIVNDTEQNANQVQQHKLVVENKEQYEEKHLQDVRENTAQRTHHKYEHAKERVNKKERKNKKTSSQK